MADTQVQSTGFDFLQPPLDFENGFGFSPATSPAKEHGKHDMAGYFSSVLHDSMSFLDQNEGELFSSYTHSSPLPKLPTPGAFSTVNAKVVHGQVTPPSDNSPVTQQEQGDNEPTPVSLDDLAVKPQPLKRKRGSQASPASTPSVTKRRKSSSAGRKASVDSLSEHDEKGEKRSKFLERNRVAASKCRQKKKEWTSNLEQKARDLQQNKTHLSMLVNSLRDEVLYLKSEVLKHDSCNCTALRSYMSRSVSQIAGEPQINDKLPALTTTASPVSDLDLDGMSFSGSPRATSVVSSTVPITSPK